ncbi:TetR/AcrR family transcriptional regulator [Streptomyces sp. TRM 70361]|uniref:TetR/AcrR family transcriptional regulator n=1 Tax=Streptomyces sp. TRM 70361 TaxID=3116553 RepID=UPI002E7B190C|nr:TetR/AcrR family transcriptional regulator [Streptomyces sp. TRM 70361]MEE1938343.1 TetR/AcrR family transcriptional regulator [Streptomyces sp. TRM 70361]
MTSEQSDSGYLRRSLDLMWGRNGRPARGPKPGLTLERIVTAGIEVADAGGIDALSMRRVAAELGVGTMSLYRYVPGKAELLELMIDQVYGMTTGTDGPRDGGWRAVLEYVARGTWEMHLAHPWLLQVNVARPVLGPNAVAGLDYALAALAGLDLTDRERLGFITALDGYVTGCARTHVNAAQAARHTGISDEEFWSAQAPTLEKAMYSGAYPHVAALAEDTFAVPGERLFAFGLARLLDGLEEFLAARTAGRAGRELEDDGAEDGPGGVTRGECVPGETDG